jgi:hypothetical protein
VNVFIANFGTGNWAWKDGLQTSTIAVMDDVRVHPGRVLVRQSLEGWVMGSGKKLERPHRC